MPAMKHTSINLSDEHMRQIKESGESPTAIIRKALNAYFSPQPSALELIREHERLYHMHESAHENRLSLNP